MSDVDRGAVLLHLHKRGYEGSEYAIENYPCRYLQDPELVALNEEDACDHAAQFIDIAEELEIMDGDKWYYLYNLALEYERDNE